MKDKVRPLAYGSLSAAAGVLLLFLASVLPNGRLAVLCIATLCVAFIRMLSGWKWALGCYAVTAALSLLLLPSKAMPILYAAFFGYYPRILRLYSREKSQKIKIVDCILISQF